VTAHAGLLRQNTAGMFVGARERAAATACSGAQQARNVT